MTIHLTRGTRGLVAAAAVASVALALVGCTSTPTTTASTGATTGGDTSSLDAAVAKAEAPLDAYPVPTDAVPNATSYSGKTVYYIPISLQAPQFGVTGKALTAALQTVGVSVQICDGKGDPAAIGTCVNQAVSAGALGIVTDAIPYGMAKNGLDAAQAAGIPVVIQNQELDPAFPASSTLAYIPQVGSQMDTAVLQWVAKDSGGNANILVVNNGDGASPAAYLKDATDQLAKDCPNCKVTTVTVSSANFAQVAPSVSAALLNDPTINYVVNDFAQFLQPTEGGVQQAGLMGQVKGVTGASVLGVYQALASGDQYVKAAAGQAAAFEGWISADAILRLKAGVAVPTYVVPVRLFTADNIGSITLSDAAEASGEWFGPATFIDQFTQLWGVQ